MADDLNEIMRILGRLEEGQKQQRSDFDAERIATRESRLRTHEKLDKIEEDVEIVGKVAAQARDKADSVEKVVIDDVKPVTDEIRRMKLRGLGALWAIGLLATAFGFSVASFGEGVIAWLRAVLRIG